MILTILKTFSVTIHTTHASIKSKGWTRQSEEDTEELDEVRVGDRIETSDERVGDGDERRDDDGRRVVHLDDNRQSRPCGTQSTKVEQARNIL